MSRSDGTTMDRSPMRDAVRESGALFAEVDGWEMPRSFGDVAAEIEAARRGAALADRSHFGRLRVTGAKRLELLHRVSTNHVKDLADGEGAETILCTSKGRIIDRLVLRAAADHYVMVTSPNQAPVVREAIEKVRFRDDVTFEEVTASTAMMAILGPRACEAVEAAARSGLSDLKPYHWRRVPIAGASVMAARIEGGIGSGGFELIVDAASAAAVWKALLEAGRQAGLRPIGAEAHEMLRVEAGAPAFGREITEEFNPLEARLDAAVHWSKGCYTGQEVIARLDSRQKVQKLLVGFAIDPGGVVEPRSRVFAGKLEVGMITSVAPSLSRRRVLALGYVRNGHDDPGTRVEVHSAGAAIGAEVSALPFPPPTPANC